MFFPHAITGQLGYIPSPTWVDAALADPTLNQKPIGTGPFKYDSRSQDSVTKFVRNDEYWNGTVWLDAVEFYPVTDPDTRVELLLNGELEGMQTTDPAQFAKLVTDQLDKAEVVNVHLVPPMDEDGNVIRQDISRCLWIEAGPKVIDGKIEDMPL